MLRRVDIYCPTPALRLTLFARSATLTFPSLFILSSELHALFLQSQTGIIILCFNCTTALLNLFLQMEAKHIVHRQFQYRHRVINDSNNYNHTAAEIEGGELCIVAVHFPLIKFGIHMVCYPIVRGARCCGE